MKGIHQGSNNGGALVKRFVGELYFNDNKSVPGSSEKKLISWLVIDRIFIIAKLMIR